MRKTAVTKFWEKVYPEIRRDIFRLCDYLNFIPSSQQADLFRKIQEDQQKSFKDQVQHFATKSGQGVGKTRASCIIMLWRQIQEVDSLGIVTAPTMRQLKTVWLAEFRRMINESHPIIRKFVKVRKTCVLFGNRDNWVINLLSASKPEAAQGLHEPHMTIMVDEASGMEREFMEQLKGTSTHKDLLFFQIGNPNRRDSDFFDCFNKNREHWICTTFSAAESELVTEEHIKRIAAEYGEDSDVYRVRVLGEFPGEDAEAIMSMDDLEACSNNDPIEFSSANSNRSFGIDLARFGSNESVITQRKGNAVIEMKVIVKTEPSDVLKRAIFMQESCGWKDASFIVDAGGMGQGCINVLYENGKNVCEFHSESRSSKRDYSNRITEAYFEFAKLVKKRSVAIPKDNMLLRQLATRSYGFDKNNKLKIESKDKYSERFESDGVKYSGSPDRADSVVMSFHDAFISGRIATR